MSTSTRYHLSPHVVVEPLVNSWAAWSAVVAPVPASLHLERYQLPLLRSFVEAPELHEEASQSPEMVGGSVVGLPATYAGEVEALIARTEREMAPHLALAAGLTAFQRTLADQAKGLSLEPYYPRVPDTLRGCVELVYDYWSRPSVRVMEPLVYRGPLYRPDLQSLRLSHLQGDRKRPYFLNTPRLVRDGQIEWTLPFADPRVDELFRLDVRPKREREIRELLQVSGDVDLAPFLSDAPRAREPWRGSEARIRYFGHACVLLERDGHSLLTDPFISAMPLDGGEPRLSFAALPPEIDYLLVTHNHLDHFCLETLLRLRHRTGRLVLPRNCGALYGDVSLKQLAEQVGFKDVVELDVFDSLPFGDGEIAAVPFLGEHADMLHSKTAYAVRAGARQILFGADSNCLDVEIYRRVRQALGDVDTVFLGMESEGAPLSFAFGSLLMHAPTREQEQSRRQNGCNAARGLELCDALGATEIYHYAMGLEPWMYYVLGLNVGEGSPQWEESESMLRTLRARGTRCERLSGRAEFVLEDAARPLVQVS